MKMPLISLLRSIPYFLSLIATVSACSVGAGPGGRQSLSGAASHDALELTETVEERAVSDVRGADTVFDLSLDADRHAWERARLFFEKYLAPGDGQAGVISKVVGSRWALASPPVGRQYQYEVWRDSIRNGYRYSVTCKPLVSGASMDRAVLNAKNLARFIRDGQLELSLVSR
jgi:hypothetical protein